MARLNAKVLRTRADALGSAMQENNQALMPEYLQKELGEIDKNVMDSKSLDGSY